MRWQRRGRCSAWSRSPPSPLLSAMRLDQTWTRPRMMLQGTALHSLFILKKILEKGTILENRYLVIVIGVLVDPKLEERRMKIIENICLLWEKVLNRSIPLPPPPVSPRPGSMRYALPSFLFYTAHAYGVGTKWTNTGGQIKLCLQIWRCCRSLAVYQTTALRSTGSPVIGYLASVIANSDMDPCLQ